MKIDSITGYNKPNCTINLQDNKVVKNTQLDKKCDIPYEQNNYRNYIIPFLGNKTNQKNNMPLQLKQNAIVECEPVNDGDQQKDTEKLSAVLSTALTYLTPKTPVLLGCSDRWQSQKFILRTFSDDDIFENEQDISHIIFVEDDRILDDPVLFVKDEDGTVSAIGDVILNNKEQNNKLILNSGIKMPIDLENHNIRFIKTDMDSISLGEVPNKRDLQHIKKFDIEEVLGKDFPESGNILSGEFTTTVPEQAKYTSGEYPMFSDIGGNKDAIQNVIESIYAPMLYPEIFGHVMNKGTILEGPPGTGKSMLGIALCNELSKKLGQKVHLQTISGAEMQISAVGGSEAKWRALFQEAIDNQPALILIDEIDACTPKRDESSNARFDNSVVNQLLSIFSNLEKSDNKVHVIGMTNRLSAIDPAMLRPGRFGEVITVPAPTYDEASEIFNKISQQYKFDESFDKEAMLKRVIKMKGTGSTIAGTLEKAAKYSRRRGNIYEYEKLMNGTVTKEDVDNCEISMNDINKALDAEEEKLKKAKISADRVIIKGFRNDN
ncbi:ATP-binding protein [bacterium]|nr:ATP-binding protein [bacterium]